jgi:hypothetical protein
VLIGMARRQEGGMEGEVERSLESVEGFGM